MRIDQLELALSSFDQVLLFDIKCVPRIPNRVLLLVQQNLERRQVTEAISHFTASAPFEAHSTHHYVVQLDVSAIAMSNYWYGRVLYEDRMTNIFGNSGKRSYSRPIWIATACCATL